MCALLVCGLLEGTGLFLLSSVVTAASQQSDRADARDALQKAALLVQQGRLEEADRQAQLALTDPETQAVACSVLGTIRFQQKRFDESASLLQKAIRMEPALVGAHLTLAQVYTLQGKSALALGLLERVLILDPPNAAARLALARFETEKGNYRQSLELAQPVLHAFKQSPEGLLVLVTDFLKTGRRAEAAALARDWTHLADVPQDWSIKFALLLAKDAAVNEAIDVLEHARHVSPPSYELAFNLGGAYLLNGDAMRALESYDLALTLKPDSVGALRQAAAIAERQGELERALSYWIRARKIEPDDPEIRISTRWPPRKSVNVSSKRPRISSKGSSESSPAIRSFNMRWDRCSISRADCLMPPNICVRASGCSQSSLRRVITSLLSRETRVTTLKPSRRWKIWSSGIPGTRPRVRRWAAC